MSDLTTSFSTHESVDLFGDLATEPAADPTRKSEPAT